ncbi:oligopeptide/dipeptide ABC transporter ATP-binding protein, partial [Lysinibacillus sp. D4A1_S13]|uniref:oligopeptide/dipeptide ABC transporter ATP-binding protein n=1 Tax=Lysinibacillus sp. D4A1_S13 TaxID=2941228 RepID=UPI0032E04702
ILLITHDLGVVSEAADRVIVMYCGQVVESASVEDLFFYPLHPYTEGLLNSITVIDGEIDTLKAIKGSVPTPDNLLEGSRFAPRCSPNMDKCKT